MSRFLLVLWIALGLWALNDAATAGYPPEDQAVLIVVTAWSMLTAVYVMIWKAFSP